MTGRGAWARFYQSGDRFPDGSRDAYAIIAFKAELDLNGYGKGIVPNLPAFGDAMMRRVREFQKERGIGVDGVIGPATGRALFHKRTLAEQMRRRLPDPWLGKLKTLESANDPVAEGRVDDDDEGIMQINVRIHGISLVQAWTPAYSIRWGAEHLAAALSGLGDIEAAVAAHNVGGYYARKWLEAGKPQSGGPPLGGQDVFTRAARYVEMVRGSLA